MGCVVTSDRQCGIAILIEFNHQNLAVAFQKVDAFVAGVGRDIIDLGKGITELGCNSSLGVVRSGCLRRLDQ